MIDNVSSSTDLTIQQQIQQQMQAELLNNNNLQINEPQSIEEISNNLIADLQSDGNTLFKRIDTNGDGKIDKSELQTFLGKASKGKQHRHHKTGQANNNKTQDNSQQTNKTQAGRKSFTEQLVEQIFAKLDPNNTGFITNNALPTGTSDSNPDKGNFLDLLV